MIEGSLKTTVGLMTVVFAVCACSGSQNNTIGAGGSSSSGSSSGSSSSGGSGSSSSSGGSGGSSSGGSSSSSSGSSSNAATGGSSSNAATGGKATGGTSAATGGKASGGSSNVGGSSNAATGGSSSNAATGGKTTGGTSAATGGKASGGSSSGGSSSNAATGGKTTGGTSAATGGKASGGSATGGSSGGTKIVLPTANASWDYQIGGAYTPPSGVKVVSRDRNSAPASGLYNICYVNGFQIQPDEESVWTSQHPTLILRDSSGTPVVDADWGEMLLDTSTDAKRTQLAAIVGGWITKCKTDGFDAVEIDNLDSYSRSTGLLTQANNIAFMAQLSAIAHQNGLAIAQKNSSELLGSVAAMGTDFAVVEECNRYSECNTYTAVYGNLVFIVEYRTQDFQTGCSKYPELSIVLRDLNVSTPSSSSYVYQGC